MSALTVSKEEEKRLKGLGFLNNKGTDNFSARVITVNGKISAAQAQCLTEAAEKFGNGVLTFTTRQTVEIQGIPYKNVCEFLRKLRKNLTDHNGRWFLYRIQLGEHVDRFRQRLSLLLQDEPEMLLLYHKGCPEFLQSGG